MQDSQQLPSAALIFAAPVNALGDPDLRAWFTLDVPCVASMSNSICVTLLG